MDIIKYITDNALILIPVIYIIGCIIRGIDKTPNKYIPIILLPAGIGFSVAMMGFNVKSVIQGILVVGASVYTNQVIKQCGKKE